MKLLIVTQAVDTEDPVLGFFVGWIRAIAKRAERVEVICLREGKHELPENVRVHSLGKERGRAGRAAYAWRFLRLAWSLRKEYGAVFVHMNQEYVLIAGWLWKLLGKRIYMWRNHYAGTFATDLAASFCTKIFCTSKHSYTAKFKKTTLMPVGVDTVRFAPDARVTRVPRSILFLSRMAPSKRPAMLVDALIALAKDGVAFTATFVGSPLSQDEAYYKQLEERARSAGLGERITWKSGVPNSETPDLYRAHEIFVNASPSGMFDKTLFEAAASGAIVLASSEDFAKLAGEESCFDSAETLAARLKDSLGKKPALILAERARLHSLSALADALTKELT
ncbi:glycosyltransferase family 4 protein [Patescibacteria group bacterium]|nr:glycosyltransferase family 4 protein [Patescibacteria group bacterium]